MRSCHHVAGAAFSTQICATAKQSSTNLKIILRNLLPIYIKLEKN